MGVEKKDSIISRVMAERNQTHETRKELYCEIEEHIGRPVISLFTSFQYPVMMDDSDAEMLEGMLKDMDLENGLALIISSPGGDGVAAERMIKICRSYSKTGEYWAIIPGKAKSAATLLSLGASQIIMGPASELGPVDPQIIVRDNHNGATYMSACHVVESYKNLFEKAVNEKDGRLEPYLQQLEKYDASVIEHYKSMIALAKDISIKALKSGMMAGLEEKVIEEKIKIFLTPEKTKTHGRPIFRDVAQSSGLNIISIETLGNIDSKIFELYTRGKYYTESGVSKLIESKLENAVVGPIAEK